MTWYKRLACGRARDNETEVRSASTPRNSPLACTLCKPRQCAAAPTASLTNIVIQPGLADTIAPGGCGIRMHADASLNPQYN